MPGALNVLSLRVLVAWAALDAAIWAQAAVPQARITLGLPTFRGDDDQRLAALLMQPFKSAFTAGADSPDGR